MVIAGLQKLTTTDFPGVIAAIVFTQGCNLKCPYCQNSGLIPISISESSSNLSQEEFFEFLAKRKKVLEGIVITGGEPLVQKDLKEFIQKIKALGYLIKLDTNGTNPEKLKELLDENLVDYVAMDVKNDFTTYDKTSGTASINMTNIQQSIQTLKESNVPHEFRTTIVKEFHTADNIQKIASYLGKEQRYFIQNFEDSSNVLNHRLHGFTKDELISLQKKFEIDYPNLKVRGL